MRAPGDPRPQRLTFLAHNRNHVNLFSPAAARLSAEGVDVAFATIADHPDRAPAAAALAKLPFPHIDIAELERRAKPGDIVVVGNDWGPRAVARSLERMQKRGAHLVGVIEGARFAFPKQYVRVDEVLVWGPSGQAAFAKPTRVIGSPNIERARFIARNPPERPRALVNYKFAYGAEDEGFTWGAAAVAAASAIDPDYVLSTHPASVGVPEEVHRSHAPFYDLLADATLLITRSSTVIYEALTAGVSVIYFPLPEEKRAEFAEPMGAFATAENAEQLVQLARAHAEQPAFNPAQAAPFLAHHVSIDPAKTADERLALALMEILAERRSVGRGLLGLWGRMLSPLQSAKDQ
jgi:hypothetical protein